MRKIFGKVVTPQETFNATVAIDDEGLIAEIHPGRLDVSGSDDIDAPGYLVLPGFVDHHIHGGGGADFMDGNPDAVRLIGRTHAKFGTTGLLATTLTASREETRRAVTAVHDVACLSRQQDEARILGIHLEGPYLCAKRCGAQPLEYIREPDSAEFEEWIDLSGGLVRKITLAPEIAGAGKLIETAMRRGIVVSIGHSDATADEVDAAIALGASHATHLFNGMRGLHHREPGTAGALLASPRVTAEVIADGIHLDPRIVRLVVSAKGPENVLLITDAMSGAAMGDGDYTLGGAAVTVRNGMATLADGTLAGSVLTMNQAFVNTGVFTGLGLDALARMTSTNAARELGLDTLFGSIAPGRPADLVVLEPETGNVIATIIDGKDAYRG